MAEKLNLPNLIIAGVVKGGTTSLFSYLSKHPQVCSSSIKETCYFHGYRYGYETPSLDMYLGYFDHYAGQKYIMEATPGYFEGGRKLAAAIKDKIGDDVKIIIMLREPVDRFISFFKFQKSMLNLDKNLPIDDYIEMCLTLPIDERLKEENDRYWGIDGGYYDNYLEGWFEVFGDSLKVTFFDDLKKQQLSVLEDICSWLKLDSSVYSTLVLEHENKTVGYKNKLLQRIALFVNKRAEKLFRAQPALKSKLRNLYYLFNGAKYNQVISDEAIKRLRLLYSDHNARLAKQLKARGYLNLPSWLSQDQ